MTETKFMIYRNLIELIKDAKNNQEPKGQVSEENLHYFKQGLNVAIQLIEQEQEFVYSDAFAYENFEGIVQSYLDGTLSSLTPEEMKEIIDENLTLYLDDETE